MRSSRRRLLAALATTVLIAGCTGSSPPEGSTAPPETSQPPPELTGKVLGAIPLSNYTQAAIVDLSTGEVTDVEGEDIGDENFLGAAAWGSDGNAYMTVDRITRQTGAGFSDPEFATQLLRITPDGTATPLGPEILAGAGLLGERDGVVYVLSCDEDPGVLALDVDAPDEWRQVADGCPAALSPDGDEVATLVQDGEGSRVVVTSLDDGATRVVVRLEELSELRTQAGLPRAPVQILAWGEHGIAVLAGREVEGSDRSALVFLPDDGEPRVHALGSAYTFAMTWQPGGSMLAFQQCLDCIRRFLNDPRGEVRVYDAASDSFLVVASSGQEFGPLAWSPDGSTLLSSVGEGDVLVLDASGAVLGPLELTVEPLAWAP